MPLFLYCSGLWIRSQSDNYELLSFIAKDHDVAVVTGLFATPIAFVSLWLAARYARLCVARSPAARVPKILEKGLEGKTGRGFRITLFLGVWFVILGSQIHFVHGVLTGSVRDVAPQPSVIFAKGPLEMLIKLPHSGSGAHDFLFGNEHGPTYFPVVETWWWLLTVSALLVSFFGYVSRRLRLPRR
ncbi:MAG: hypothetical protein JWO52_5351 [Gammaproteobacteria bacterium]|nr:hypothetical protein [Gammaproteobacteria bacterium]